MEKSTSMTLAEQEEQVRSTAEDNLKELLKSINSKSTETRDLDKVQVLLYFDEAHVLALYPNKTSNPPSNKDNPKLMLGHLANALNVFCRQPLFTIFLSTQSNIEHLAPASRLARSARIRDLIGILPAPITETMFDCFNKNERIAGARLLAHHPSDIVYMSLFGRPLYVPCWLRCSDWTHQCLDGAA
jgi:hypothetical protein